MSKTVIPDLKNKLKQMLIDFVEKYKYFEFEDRNTYKYYYTHRHEKYEKDNDIFFDKVLNKVIYEMEHSEIIRNLVRIEEIKGCSSCDFSFIGLEQNEEIPILISAPFYDEDDECINKIRTDISPNYIDELKNKTLPNIFYKDSGYFIGKKTFSIVTYNEIAVHWDYQAIILKDDLSKEFMSSISYFIDSKDLYIMNIETKNINITRWAKEDVLFFGITDNFFKLDELRNAESKLNPKFIEKLQMVQDNMAKGIKLYKIPYPQFDVEPYLKKIERKFNNLKSPIDCLEDYILYFKYHISFEYSPDGYFEIYGTEEALRTFILPSENGFEMGCGEEYKIIRFLSHFVGEVNYKGILMCIFHHHFGSKKNEITKALTFNSLNY